MHVLNGGQGRVLRLLSPNQGWSSSTLRKAKTLGTQRKKGGKGWASSTSHRERKQPDNPFPTVVQCNASGSSAHRVRRPAGPPPTHASAATDSASPHPALAHPFPSRAVRPQARHQTSEDARAEPWRWRWRRWEGQGGTATQQHTRQLTHADPSGMQTSPEPRPLTEAHARTVRCSTSSPSSFSSSFLQLAPHAHMLHRPPHRTGAAPCAVRASRSPLPLRPPPPPPPHHQAPTPSPAPPRSLGAISPGRASAPEP